MKKILIELIITNSCNKRCEYCDLDFRNTFISDKSISLFIDFINKEKNIDFFHINFFGGEPLLGFDKIKRIIDGINRKNIKYSIGTNGVLLNVDILEFFLKNKVNISLSIDNKFGFKNVFNITNKYFKLIEINFINDPDYLFNSKKVFDEIVKRGYRKVNIMPVYTTKIRNISNLINLGKIVKYINNVYDIEIKYYYYYNGVSNEKQFILDTDGIFYNDLDGLLWLQKQYDIINTKLKNDINIKTQNLALDKSFNFTNLYKKYNEKDILDLLFEIPNNLLQNNQNLLIKKIFDNVK